MPLRRVLVKEAGYPWIGRVNVGLAIVIALALILSALLQIRAGFVLDPCSCGARWL